MEDPQHEPGIGLIISPCGKVNVRSSASTLTVSLYLPVEGYDVKYVEYMPSNKIRSGSAIKQKLSLNSHGLQTGIRVKNYDWLSQSGKVPE